MKEPQQPWSTTLLSADVWLVCVELRHGCPVYSAHERVAYMDNKTSRAFNRFGPTLFVEITGIIYYFHIIYEVISDYHRSTLDSKYYWSTGLNPRHHHLTNNAWSTIDSTVPNPSRVAQLYKRVCLSSLLACLKMHQTLPMDLKEVPWHRLQNYCS